MKTELAMTIREADRYTLMKQIESQKITIKEASQVLGISYRQARRLWQRYQREGPKGLISKRKGKERPSNGHLCAGKGALVIYNIDPPYAYHVPSNSHSLC